MKTFRLIAASAAILLVAACAHDNLLPAKMEENPVAEQPESATDAIPGQLIIKVTEELAAEIESVADSGGIVNPVAVKSMSDAPLEIHSMKRLFPYAGKFEARTRAEGLHKWYVVEYDKAVATRSAASAIALPGVTEVEIPRKIALVGNPEVVSYVTPQRNASDETTVFNDPMLADQWHYYNDGTVTGSVSGCDINVVPVWERYTTGNPDVIVSVVDGGIDFRHEDLADNMWENPEESGNRKFGYNFVTNGPLVTSDDHGTHVAGTIAAVNNNGIGVCGVAGGNAAAGQSGVKLMSCQIFQGEDQGNGATAIKWGADHGAVISQNSWGYTDATSTPQSTKEAIDYFIKYAGMDENGVQTGPMQGGLVVFAAGNDNASISYPAEYENVVAVSAVGADYQRAYYSNYGQWADIAAPGGDVRKGNLTVTLSVRKTGGAYALSFHTEGTVTVPCDRCLDDLELPVETDDRLIVKLGTDFAEEEDIITVPEEDGYINVGWYIYEFIMLSLPIKHVHAPGECNAAMTEILSRHLATETAEETDPSDEEEDTTGNGDIDPRWNDLRKILDNN